MSQVYPFTAIVEQEKMKKALILNAINPLIGGVLLRGDKGTGKSTAVRALAEVLPEMEVAECRFSCSPDMLCPECLKKKEAGELKFTKRKMRVVELPLSATEDRVVGTVDVETALRNGVVSFRPGILAEANNSILYIDEVNLLEDYIVDTLLDVAASGWNIVEREGVSVRHPSRFVLVGTMNPEEGELRPQLLDRFGMVVDIKAITEPDLRAEVVRRAEEFTSDPIAFRKKYEREQERLKKRITMARTIFSDVVVEDNIIKAVAKLCSELGIETHRADITTIRAARAIAAFKGRKRIEIEDVLEAAELTLPHRVKSRPFDPPQVDFDRLEGFVKENLQEKAEKQSDGGDKYPSTGRSGSEEKFDARETRTPEIEIKSKHLAKKGKRVRTLSNRGRYVRFRLDGEQIAVGATIRAAFSRGVKRPSFQDLRYRFCSGKSASSIALLVDASGSMASLKRMEIAKGVLLRLLQDAYVKRDRVSLVVFRGDSAEIIVPPTSSPQLAYSRVGDIPTGGKTPLPIGLYTAYQLLRREKSRGYVPILVLISDGRGNVSMGTGNVKEEVIRVSEAIARDGIPTVVIDADDHVSLGFTTEIASITGALHYRLRDLDAERIFEIVEDLKSAI